MRALSLDRQVVVRALALALSAWVAFTIAALQHIHNPYWAAMPVWVVAQASRGVVLERALFRVLGTLLGALAGFAILQVPASPYAQFALLGLWMAVNGGLTHVLRGVHGYGALLAGVTAAIVVIPAVLAPGASLSLATARVECTLIGVVVATVIIGLATPRSPSQAFFAQMRRLAADAVACAAQMPRRGAAALEAEERRILGEISEVEASSRLILAGSFEGYRRLHDVDSLVVGSLAIMSASAALWPEASSLSPSDGELALQLDRVAELLRQEAAPRLPGSPSAPAGDPPGTERLRGALDRILAASAALERPLQAATLRPFRRRLAVLAPHREWSQAGRTALAAGTATFLAAALAHATGSPLVVQAAVGVSIFSLVLGSLALPQQIAPKLLTGVVGGALLAVFYRLAVQPALGSTVGLLLSMVPFLLLGGLLRAHPRTAIAGVDTNMCFLLASQAGTTAVASPGDVIGGAAALAAAAGLVAGNYILMPRSSVRQAEEAVDLIRRDLLRMVESDPGAVEDWRARGSRQILRLSLHLGRSKDLGERWPKGMLAVLSLGQAIEQLHELPSPEGGAGKAEALRTLQHLAEDPLRTAVALRSLAGPQAGEALGRVLLDLAQSLEASTDLLAFGRPGPVA